MEQEVADKTLSAEFNDIKHERGIVSMASNEINSADSQFLFAMIHIHFSMENIQLGVKLFKE